ncbi:hypothetical protein CL653_03600 [bacterium]|nr:hypothetical protein [bacterium]|tara:strand:- start:88 stop:357 length:270 start_codon:yes stop_codon:yes gene_type:complete
MRNFDCVIVGNLGTVVRDGSRTVNGNKEKAYNVVSNVISLIQYDIVYEICKLDCETLDSNIDTAFIKYDHIADVTHISAQISCKVLWHG